MRSLQFVAARGLRSPALPARQVLRVRTFPLVAVLLCVSAAADRVDGQGPLLGTPPQPAELVAPDSAAPTPPVPGPFVPPGESRFMPPASAQPAPSGDRVAPTYTPPASSQPADRQPTYVQPNSQPVPSYGGSSSPAVTSAADQPPDVSPNNPEKWRYVYRNGGWWYYTPTKQWLYWSGGRWIEYARPAVSNTSVYVQPPVYYRRPRLNIGVGVGPGYYPYGAYPYGPYPYGYGYPYGPYGYGGYGRVGVGVGVGMY